jgi:hypothetical protein
MGHMGQIIKKKLKICCGIFQDGDTDVEILPEA